MAETGQLVQREAQKKVRVTFPNGEVICYKRVVNTLIKPIRGTFERLFQLPSNNGWIVTVLLEKEFCRLTVKTPNHLISLPCGRDFSQMHISS